MGRRKKGYDITTDKTLGAEETPQKVEFCVNCDDMDELALNPQSMESAKTRFHNCKETGKFQGDVCSRLYVLEPNADPGPIFDED